MRVVAGYDIEPYATNRDHEYLIHMQWQHFVECHGRNAISLQRHIDGNSPSAPVTGDMIMAAAERYDVDPFMIASRIQIDSHYGTRGKGAETRNPGNVGNDDEGNIRTYPNWQDGVNAVAEWLSRHRVGGRDGHGN